MGLYQDYLKGGIGADFIIGGVTQVLVMHVFSGVKEHWLRGLLMTLPLCTLYHFLFAQPTTKQAEHIMKGNVYGFAAAGVGSAVAWWALSRGYATANQGAGIMLTAWLGTIIVSSDIKRHFTS